MARKEKKAIQEHLQELMEGSNLKRKEYGSVILSVASENGLEQLLKISWRVSIRLQVRLA